jgi:REP element-mobilizing transposase RayT
MQQNKNINYDPEKHHRRSIRLKGYDYTRPGAYFVTMCTEKGKCLFGEISDEIMQLNKFGTMIHACWNNIPKHFAHIRLDACVVMPNHIHGILIITDANIDRRGEAFSSPMKSCPGLVTENASPLHPITQSPHGTSSGSLGAIMQNFKSVSTRKINQLNKSSGAMLWQRNYYEHIVRNEYALNAIRRYITYNPLMWSHDMDNPDRRNVSEEELKYETKKRCNFTNEELDFISSAKLRTGIRYDIKYRTGQDYVDNKP